ncbi:MAG: biotin carboxyl carrier protein [Planctomycetota bacterium]|jgi:biotin carboxyl carrier protein
MNKSIELLALRTGDKTSLNSPGVGLFTCALQAGELLGPGQIAGVLMSAGHATTLVLPANVSGRISSARPKRVHEPVGYGTTLYELSPIDEGALAHADQAEQSDESGLILRATQGGRFYRSPSPDEAAYVEIGAEITGGTAIGLVEIMKTFGQVSYEAKNGLPARAKLVRWLCEDGAEIREGDALLEVEAI